MTTLDWVVYSFSCCFVSGFPHKYIEVMGEAFHRIVSTFVLLLREARLATKQQFILWNISKRSSC